MARIILLALLFFFCVSDALSPDSLRYDFNNEISLNLPFNSAVTIVDASEMCKPTGVETVIYTDGKAEPAPEKKKPVAKTPKKKASKKTQPKKA